MNQYRGIYWQNFLITRNIAGLGGSADARLTGDQEVVGLTPAGSATFFVEIDHEMFSMVILCLPLFKKSGSWQWNVHNTD